MLREFAIAVRNIAIGGSPTALTMVTKPREMVAYVGECLFLKRLLAPNGSLPQLAPWKLFGVEQVPVVIEDNEGEWVRNVASYSADLIGLCALAQITHATRIFEIGTLHGSGALHLALNAPQATVYTLDLPPDGAPVLNTTMVDRLHVELRKKRKLLFEGKPEGQRIRCLYGDSATFDFKPYVGTDLFFIDGAHSYDYVRNDTLKALECCGTGSVIAWHDYGRVGVNGVTRWLHEFRHGREIYRMPGGSLAYMVIA